MYCTNCGKSVADNSVSCVHCGHVFKPVSTSKAKNKVVFVLLALFLGGLGIHRMYIGDWLLGILYLVFCWTGIPMFIAFIEAIVIGLRDNDPRFE